MTLDIGEVARRAGLATSALRYYEREGLLPAAGRRGGRRIYALDALERLALIELCKRAGFRIGEIKLLLAGVGRRSPPGRRWRALGARKLAELDARIAEAERMKGVLRSVMRCECPTLDDCARAVQRAGRGRP